MATRGELVFRTARGVEVRVEKGRKGPFDFVVRYREPNHRTRTPKHIHLIIDLYMKRTGDRPLTEALVDYILDGIIAKVKPATKFPPGLQTFSPEHVKRFEALDAYGEYSVEFLLVVVELVMIQEKTNYPNGTMNVELFQGFRRGSDIFGVVSKATFRGR